MFVHHVCITYVICDIHVQRAFLIIVLKGASCQVISFFSHCATTQHTLRFSRSLSSVPLKFSRKNIIFIGVSPRR